ncbi:MAG: hydrogenase maturation nickel metallochaperone HypA [Chloroflexi bacterium]|nr:hydrogenase maturation nickel metallochaperone HypA [Chloroflexota bacterium]
MHELGITEDLLAHVLEHAAEAGIKKVTSVRLGLGDMAGIEPDAVSLCFEAASRGTPAQGAELVFRRIETELRCRFCGNVFTPSQFDEPCPQCQRLNLEVLNGQDFYLESIEGE